MNDCYIIIKLEITQVKNRFTFPRYKNRNINKTTMHEKLLIFQKTYDFTLWIYPVINKVPKSHRMVLGKTIEELTLSLLLSVIKANRLRGPQRTKIQLNISDNLDQIRFLLRLIKDLKFISIKQYALGAEKVNEIARMLNAWMRV